MEENKFESSIHDFQMGKNDSENEFKFTEPTSELNQDTTTSIKATASTTPTTSYTGTTVNSFVSGAGREKITQEEMESYAARIDQIAENIQELNQQLRSKMRTLSVNNEIWYSPVSVKTAEQFEQFAVNYEKVVSKLGDFSTFIRDTAATFAKQDTVIGQAVESELHE